MGERQTLLKSITEDIYSGSLIKSPKLSIFEIEYSGLINEVERVYSALGGTSEEIPINYGPWDISLKDFCIELDEENGSSRWRQRAFYDFIKDLNSVIRKVPILRISIYDTYNGNTVNEMLIKKDVRNLRAFLKDLKI